MPLFFPWFSSFVSLAREPDANAYRLMNATQIPWLVLSIAIAFSAVNHDALRYSGDEGAGHPDDGRR